MINRKNETIWSLLRAPRNILSYIFITIVAFFSLFPFAWMVMGATNSTEDLVAGSFKFGTKLGENFETLTSTIDLPRVLGVTFEIAILGTLASILVSSLAGYGFEIFRSRVREGIYKTLLLLMMVPFISLLVPLFLLAAKLKMLNSVITVILPLVASIYTIFFFRQSAKAFPRELLEAARLDGLGEFGIFFRIFMPTMKSTYAAAAINLFMIYWNNFLWTLVVMQSENMKTMNLALSSFVYAYVPDYGLLTLASIITTLPMVFVFFVMQRQFVEGMLGSVK
jgi:lactose/L-arabinose transport system permease protein